MLLEIYNKTSIVYEKFSFNSQVKMTVLSMQSFLSSVRSHSKDFHVSTQRRV